MQIAICAPKRIWWNICGTKLSETEPHLSDGAQGRNRTTDTVIFSHVLYQLSYLGAEPAARRACAERGGL